MSDGPYRSLKMRKGWQKVAEFAEACAFSPSDISEAVKPALAEDWRVENVDGVAKAVCDIFGGDQGSLFRDRKTEQLEGLRPETTGGLSQLVIECALRQADQHELASDPAVAAIADALAIWSGRHARSMEEHYCREWDGPRAREVRNRVEQGCSGADFQGLARQLLGIDARRVGRTPPKQSGIEDGAPL